MAFRFRFEDALEARKIEERKAQEAMAPLVSRHNQLAAALEKIEANHAALETDRIHLLSDADSVLTYSVRAEAARAHRLQIQRAMQETEESLEPLRRRLREAIGRRKGLEVLKERERMLWRSAEEKKAEASAAETAVARKIATLL